MAINPIGIAVPFFLLLIAVEYLLLRAKGKPVRLNDAVTDISCGIGDQVMAVFLKSFALIPYGYVYHNWAFFNLNGSDPWVWVIGVFGVDLFYYFYHRVCHRVNLGWATHSIHHQSEAYNLSVALRQPWFSIFFGWVFYLPLALLGLPLEVYVTTFAFNLLYQFWIHTETISRMGVLELFMNTPSHHRVHHGTNPKYIDKNYAGIFIIWDRLFGTFQQEDETPLYGTLKPLQSWNPVWANIAPWVELSRRSMDMKAIRHKVGLWFAPPEWTPDGKLDIEAAFNGPNRGYDVDRAQSLHPYILLNLALSAIVVGVVLTFENQLSQTTKAGACGLLIWTLVVWGMFFEGSPKAWYAELCRIIAICLFIFVH